MFSSLKSFYRYHAEQLYRDGANTVGKAQFLLLVEVQVVTQSYSTHAHHSSGLVMATMAVSSGTAYITAYDLPAFATYKEDL